MAFLDKLVNTPVPGDAPPAAPGLTRSKAGSSLWLVISHPNKAEGQRPALSPRTKLRKHRPGLRRPGCVQSEEGEDPVGTRRRRQRLGTAPAGWREVVAPRRALGPAGKPAPGSGASDRLRPVTVGQSPAGEAGSMPPRPFSTSQAGAGTPPVGRSGRERKEKENNTHSSTRTTTHWPWLRTPPASPSVPTPPLTAPSLPGSVVRQCPGGKDAGALPPQYRCKTQPYPALRSPPRSSTRFRSTCPRQLCQAAVQEGSGDEVSRGLSAAEALLGVLLWCQISSW